MHARVKAIITTPAAVVAKYCNEHVYVSVCVSVCLFVSIFPEPHARSLPIFMHVAYRCGSVSSSRVTQSQGKGAILGVFFFVENALYRPYSSINFATKNRFGLNLLLYHNVGQNQFHIIKRHNCD